MCALTKAGKRTSSGRHRVLSENMPESTGERQTTKLSPGSSIRKTKERFLVAGDLWIKRFTGLRILPQEGARSMEQVNPEKMSESLGIPSRGDGRYFSLEVS